MIDEHFLIKILKRKVALCEGIEPQFFIKNVGILIAGTVQVAELEMKRKLFSGRQSPSDAGEERCRSSVR
jgi:hypothetical protein